MKPPFLIISWLTLLTFHSAGQSLQWGNAFGTTTSGLRAPIYGVDSNDPYTPRTGNTLAGLPSGTQTYGGPLLEGAGFTAALFAGTAPDEVRASLTAVDMATFRTGDGAGLIVGPRGVGLPGWPCGVSVSLQVRAWDNQGGTVTSWGQVLSDPSIPRGQSDIFPSGPLAGTDPNCNLSPVPQTLALRSFNLVIVPEPSALALGLLAVGALFWRRLTERPRQRPGHCSETDG